MGALRWPASLVGNLSAFAVSDGHSKAPPAKKTVEDDLKRLAKEPDSAEGKQQKGRRSKKAAATCTRVVVLARQSWRDRTIEQRERLMQDLKRRLTHEQIAWLEVRVALNNFRLDS